MAKKLSDEGEIIAAHMAATTSAFVVLVRCLEENGALGRGQFPEALRGYMELAKDRSGPMVLALLDDLRRSLLH